MAQAVSLPPFTAEYRVQSMWDLWSTKWHWDRFFPEYFGFPLSISFHRVPLHGKTIKLIIIARMHNKPLGCGASVASAAGPFTTKTKTLC
jgi:hypothetical protein